MVTKILLTLAVIAGCYLFLKYKRKSAVASSRSIPETDIDPQPPFRLLAVILVVLALAGGGAVAAYHWIDGNTLMTVEVTPANGGETQHYTVYKRDLELRRFTTVEGLIVRVADSDRLAVSELEE